MSNDYFNHVTNVVPAGARALSAQVNSIANEIATGLDKLPTEVQLKQNRTIYAGADTGAADAYVVSLPYTPTLTDGLNFFFKASNANTGPSTLNLNALGAKSILLASGAALVGGDILLNQQIWLAYESVSDSFRIMSQSSSAGGGGGNATTIALLDESVDTTNFVTFAPDATGNQPLRTGTNLTFNSATGNLAATTFTGAVVGNVTGDVSGSAATVTGAAQAAITSVGTLTSLDIQQDGAATSLNVTVNNTGDLGAYIHSNTASRTAPLLEVTNDNATGIGQAAIIRNDQSGIALQAVNTNAAGKAAQFYSTVATRTVPVVEIVNDNATGSGVALLIQQDQGGAAIELTSQGTIKFPATATPSADVNTLDDYEEGEFTVSLDPQSSGTITLNPSNDSLAYVKIGKMVFIQGRIVVSSVSSPLGAIRMSGLPFAFENLAEDADNIRVPVYGRNFNTLADKFVLGGQVVSGTEMTLDDTDLAALTTEIVAGTILGFNLHYRASA